ncbi:UpxY family transcription antiterminator [Rosettibacter firmus]|uniref:UpxY family transcription antiterminator n=1 Tax=Rosettibacter firmus TaxID=3111522 RepID=UPI00336BC8E1
MCTNNIELKHWFAFYTKPRHEFKAQQQFEALSISHYLPTIERVRQWKDRKKKIIEPLFRGYIFVYGDEKERLIALQQSAIVKTICFNGKPSIIPDYQIENLKIMLNEKPEVFITNQVECGESVKIIDGPFKGIVGKVKLVCKEKWLAVSIDLLQRSVLVKLPLESVIKLL